MFAARPHEPHNLYSTPMTSTGRRSQKSSLTSAALLSWSTVLALCSAGISVSATPIQAGQGLFAKRDGSSAGAGAANQDQSLSPKIWIPIVIAIIVLFCIGLMTWTKTSWRKTLHLFSFAGSATLPSSGVTGARELTAEQLAGTINGTGAANANNPPRTTRRTRRPRRTPSQMSVTSLPEYNKEPGEEELVIFRGRDAEDATTMPTAVAMTSIDEDRSSLLSQDNSQVSRYSPMPTSPNDMPLLRDDDVDAAYGDLSLQSLAAEGEDMPVPRRSSDTGSHETSSLMRAEESNVHLPESTTQGAEHEQDPRGEAPPYFEVVDLTEMRHNRTDSDGSIGVPEPQFQSYLTTDTTTNPTSNTNNTTITTTDTTTTTTNANTNANRRSGFRTLLNRMSMVGHTRNESTSSAFSSNLSVSQPRPSTSTSTHSRPSTSMFRTLSRQRSTHTLNSPSASNPRLTSPSLISLQSISAPLTHTVTRTEFTYPKAGPTAEQLKVISSRESFARFGVPYGADAIAFAASASALNLSGIPDDPPPGFEEGASQGQAQRAPTPGPSRLRSESNAGASGPRVVVELQEIAQPQSTPSSSIPPSSSLSAATPPPKMEEQIPPSSSTTNAAAAAVETPYSSSSISKSHNGSISGPAPMAQLEPETAQHTALATSSTSIPKQTPSVSEFGKLSAPPPSSFSYADHSASASSTRSGSRASVFSYQSYATAAESLTPSSAQAFFSDAEADSDADVGDVSSEPSTPRIGGKHVLEMTDTTIIPGDRDRDKRRTILAFAGVAGTSSSGQ